MKNSFLFILTLFPFVAASQVFTSTSTMFSSGTVLMTEKHVEYLKNSKTYFIVPDEMEADLGEITNILQKVWDFTEIKAITVSGVDVIDDKRASFFNIAGYRNDDMFYILMRFIGVHPQRRSFVQERG